MNSTFYRKTGLFVALIFGLGFGFVMIRSSMDFETAADIAKGISFIPFSPWIFKVLSSFIPMDPAMFPIPDTTPFFSALLVLLLQTFIQSPVLALINSVFGPILFRSNANEYSVAYDPDATRAKGKIYRRLGKLLAILIVVPIIAFLCGYLLNFVVTWIGGVPIGWRILLYFAIIILIVLLAWLPFLFRSMGKAYLSTIGTSIQRLIYVFITNAMVVMVVAVLVAGVSGWHFMFALLALMTWMIIYSDTDGFLISHRYRTAV